MHNATRELDVEAPQEPLTSQRHRPAVSEMFPSSSNPGYDAREAAYLRSLLAEPLRHCALGSTDERTRGIADAALGLGADREVFVDYARLEDALTLIVSTTTDEAARELAQEALALYQGR